MKTTRIRPETELLVSCVRNCEDAETVRRILALTEGPLDWDMVLGLASSQQIRPLVFSRLNHICADRPPPSVMEALARVSRSNAMRNLRLAGETTSLLQLFAEHGVTAIPMKGPFQAAALYGDLSLREIADLDFLVRREDILAAKDVLCARGFLPKKIFTPEEEKKRLDSHQWYDLPFISRDGNTMVEVHWNILAGHSAFNLKPEVFWNGVVPGKIGGRDALTFSDEDAFLFQCVHNEQHNWRCLKFVCDAARMLALYRDINWDRLMGKASLLGHADTVLLTVYLAVSILDAPLPAAIADRLKQRTSVRMLGALARARLFRSGFTLPWFPEWLDCLRILEGPSADTPTALKRLSYFPSYLKAILTPEGIDRTLFPPLPRGFGALYCVARVLRFIGNRLGVHLPSKRFPEPLLQADEESRNATDGL